MIFSIMPNIEVEAIAYNLFAVVLLFLMTHTILPSSIANRRTKRTNQRLLHDHNRKNLRPIKISGCTNIVNI